jgi:hypothetical protein
MTEPASIPGGLRRFRIDLAYDGSDFFGMGDSAWTADH